MAFNFANNTQAITWTQKNLSRPPITLFATYRPTTNSVRGILIGYNTTVPYASLEYRADFIGDPLVFDCRPNAAIVSTTSSTLNAYQSVAGTRWGLPAAEGSIYLNGSLDSTIIGNSTALSYIVNLTLGQSGSVGDLADISAWNVALTGAEIASLAKGFSPRRIRPQSLVFYAPLLRNLQDLRQGLALTAVNSPTVANHPRVY